MRFLLLFVITSSLGFGQPLRVRVNLALDRGAAALKGKQAPDGRLTARLGAHALAMLALLASGVPKTDPVILRGMRPLRSSVQQNYDRAVRLMVIEKLREPMLRSVAEADAKALILNQGVNGAWGYAQQRRRYDNSNTQYAILGLRAAEKLGIPVPQRTWRRALSHILSDQHAGGGMGYRQRRSATPSMTAAALASLIVTSARSGFSDTHARTRTARRGIQRATRYLARHWKPGNLYTDYGLERGMAFSRQDRLGKREWYTEGATHLVGAQQPDGRWVNVVNTSFAMLFLARASRPTSGETPGDVGRLMRSLGAQSRAQDVGKVVHAIVKKGSAVATSLLHYLRSDDRPVRTAAVESLRRLNGGRRLGYDPALPPGENEAAIARWRTFLMR